MKKIEKASDIPETAHYAIIICNEMQSSGNMSSGGFYSPFSIEYYILNDRQKWLDAVKEFYLQKPKRTDLKAFPVEATLKVSVNIDMK